MPLPDVQINVRDPGLGIVPAGAGKTQVKLGIAQRGTPNVLYSAGGLKAAVDLLGSGPLLESVMQVLKTAGGPVLFVPLLPTTYGTVTASFAKEGVGAGTIAGSRGPEQVVRVKIVTGGALGTATFQVALGPGVAGYGAPVTTGADPYTYQLPNQRLTKLGFAVGTYVADDVYTVGLDGAVVRVGSGTATLLDGTTHSPVDGYPVWIQIMSSGAPGTGSFRYSLDSLDDLAAKAWSPTIGIPGAGKYAIPGTGIVLTFASSFVAGDLYKGVATAAGYSVTEYNDGATALLANASEWGLLHVVGKPANAAGAAALAGAVGSTMDAAQAAFRYVRGVIECPQEEGDSAVKTAFASFVHPRVGVVVGDVDLVSVLSARTERRSLAWAYMARLSATKLSSHPGQVDAANNGGALRGVSRLYRDEWATPSLDEARFVTARSIVGYPGYYITRGRMMAAPGSDFEQIMNARVMDRFCTVMRAALVLYLNRPVVADEETGHIDEAEAQSIEATLETKAAAALLGGENEASSVAITVSRDDDILATKTLNVEGDCVPFGYTEHIKASLGFKNPAIEARLAA